MKLRLTTLHLCAVTNVTAGDFLACGDAAGSNQIQKDRVVYLLDLFKGRGKKGWCDLVFGAPLDDSANSGYVYSHVVSVALILRGVDPIVRNGCGI